MGCAWRKLSSLPAKKKHENSKPQPEKKTFNQIEEGRTIYMGKPEIPIGKSHVSQHSIWEASEKIWAMICGDAIFSTLFSLFS